MPSSRRNKPDPNPNDSFWASLLVPPLWVRPFFWGVGALLILAAALSAIWMMGAWVLLQTQNADQLDASFKILFGAVSTALATLGIGRFFRNSSRSPDR